MNLDSWLASHPYLLPLANFHAQIESVLERCSVPDVVLPKWDVYTDDFRRGTPLLRSSSVNLDLKPAEDILRSLVTHLTFESGRISEERQALQAELTYEPDAPRSAIASLLDRAEFHSSCPGLLRFLGWTAMSSYLRPIVTAFNLWRDDDKWLRSYCPMCGADAAMAQLLGAEQGKRRVLCCGRCNTRWQFRRTGCPFCEAENDHSLRVFSVAGEGGLRLDYCERCRGYLKTYDGQGNEDVLLANWTSIHLDILAQDRQLNAFSETVYQLE